ncbi:hypothetical protein ONZ45_g11283 [Pleurotus djamor]|nr:hypothetical protein ONZ45_g11283 [Pleurotus djamor]
MSKSPLPTQQSSSTSTVETSQHTESGQLEPEASNADLAPSHPTLTNAAVPKVSHWYSIIIKKLLSNNKPLPVTRNPSKVRSVQSETTAQTGISPPQAIQGASAGPAPMESRLSGSTLTPAHDSSSANVYQKHNETDPDVWASYAQLLTNAIHDHDRLIASHQMDRIAADKELSIALGMMRLSLSLQKQ